MYPGNIYLLYIHTGAQADAMRQRRFKRSVEPFTFGGSGVLLLCSSRQSRITGK